MDDDFSTSKVEISFKIVGYRSADRRGSVTRACDYWTRKLQELQECSPVPAVKLKVKVTSDDDFTATYETK